MQISSSIDHAPPEVTSHVRPGRFLAGKWGINNGSTVEKLATQGGGVVVTLLLGRSSSSRKTSFGVGKSTRTDIAWG